MLVRFDTVMLGDNPFFGVDHLSHERGRQRLIQQGNFERAVQVIKCSYDLGVHDMMIGIRPSLQEFLNTLKNNSNLLDLISFHPLLPYVQGYVLKTSQQGMINTLKEVLRSAGLHEELKLIVRGGLGFLKKDISDLFRIFIDIELLKLKNLKIKTVFLHPALTDLALALNMKEIFTNFDNHLHDRYHLKSGFCTKNFPSLISKLQEWNLTSAEIMTSFNKCGFMMNPSKEKCEEALNEFDGKLVAMNIFAGGYLSLQEAYDYLSSFPKLRRVVIGVSSMDNAKQTFSLFKAQ